MITEAKSYRGDAVLLPVGAASMSGRSQEHLRTQAAQISVRRSSLPSGVYTYQDSRPQTSRIPRLRRRTTSRATFELRWTQESSPPSAPTLWCGSTAAGGTRRLHPLPFYQIKGPTGSYGRIEQTRVAAWTKGRYTGDESHDVASQWQNTVRMLESQTLQEYLLNGLGP